MTGLAILVAACSLFVLKRRARLALILAISAGFPVGVALTVGGEGIPLFYSVAIVGIGLAIIGLLGRPRTQGTTVAGGQNAGKSALLLFVAWSVVITAVSPTLFKGVAVLIPRLGIDAGVVAPGVLSYSISNLAQIAYLILAVGVVLVMSKAGPLPTFILGIPLATMTLLSIARLGFGQAGLPWPEGFFDNNPNRNFIEETASGQVRFRGIFAEPSDLATYSLVTIIFFWKSLPGFTKKGRIFAVFVILSAVVNAAVSTAGTVVAAGLVVVVILVVPPVWNFLTQGTRVSPGSLILGCFLVAGSIPFLPTVVAKLSEAIEDKVGSGSFESRTAADAFSFSVFAETWGMGAGLGSSRPSTFLPMLLSCVGLIGAVLFVVAAWRLARSAWDRSVEFRPTVWAFIVLMVCKSVAGPNMSDALMWLCLGCFANVAWRGTTTDPSKLMPGMNSRLPSTSRDKSNDSSRPVLR